MSTLTLFLLAVGLSMDAFAVAVCKGLAMNRITLKKAVIVGLWFGIFQAGMPVIGYLLGSGFQEQIVAVDHWIAFVLLTVIGGNMVKESFSKEALRVDADFSARTMFAMAVATSIDALAIGVSLAFLRVNIWESVSIIGVTTALFSAVGLYIGNAFGSRYKSKAEFSGGIILILMGVKILVEHLLG